MTSDPVDQPLGVDSREFRRVVGRFATGITVITATYEGVDHAMTANSFTSLSLDPLLVLFCCEKASRLHRAVMETDFWAVSVLSVRQRQVAQWFATRDRPLERQFAGVPHHRGPASGSILLSEAIATLECRTTGRYEGGDHTIVLGEVVAVGTPRPDAEPLLYYGGTYREFPPED